MGSNNRGVCVVGKNLIAPNWSSMADDTIIWGGVGGSRLEGPNLVVTMLTTYTSDKGSNIRDFNLQIFLFCRPYGHLDLF